MRNPFRSGGHNDRILRWLMDGGTLTHREAQRLFQCDRLAARVKDIRYVFGQDAIVSADETRNGKTWTRYRWNHPEQLDLLAS